MKRLPFLLFFTLPCILHTSCENSRNDKIISESVSHVNQSDVDADGKIFIKLASESGIMEVETAKLALQKARSANVKEFARMMIKDHTRIYNDLKKIATNKHILLPIETSPEQSKLIDELNALSGNRFEENYIRLMILNHKEAVRVFDAGADNPDETVNKFASENVEVLKAHLSSAQSIFNNLILNR